MATDIPTSLIIFGATGDLMAKKIAPAIFYLYEHGKLPASFGVVGVSRREMSDDSFRDLVRGILLKHAHRKVDDRELDRFLDLFTFARVQFEEDAGYEALADALRAHERSYGKTNRLLYLAVPPSMFPVIFKHDGFRRIVEEGTVGGVTARVIIEKPFGTDGASAKALEAVIEERFNESQVYRVDHYLAKDMLQNIIQFRFANNLFEYNWDEDTIESIHIRLWETLGVDRRGAFYDDIGAFRDVGQNHLLEMLALVTMEKPETDDAEGFRAKRTSLMHALKAFTQAEAERSTFRAQYAGYRSIEGVAPDSDVETYYALKTRLDTPRWDGVEVTMESGKRMHEMRKEIVVKFRAPYQNVVTFRLEPEEEVIIDFVSKKPGILESGTEKRTFRFGLQDENEERVQYVAEYGKLILDAIAGDGKLFLGEEEVEAAWRFTDPIVNAWKKGGIPLHTYAPDTDEAAIAAAQFFAEK